MNQIIATVEDIVETDIVTYIRLNSSDTILSLIKPKSPKWLNIGDKVYCKFQEASVCVSKDCPGKVSIENKLPATLKEVRKNDSLCELTFESDIGSVVSLITTRAYDTLELQKGCRATMLLRGVDISVEPIIEPIGTVKP
jgi:molybdopterin-binding protein